MIVVLAAMIGSLTVLPALLHRLGDNVDRGRIPFFRGRPRDDGAWGRFVALVLRRPLLAARCRRAALALALPGCRHAHEAAEPDRPPPRPEDRAHVRADPAGVPGLADAGGGRRPGAEGRHAADAARVHLFRERALATGELFAPFTVT